jgi:cytochrome bd ubiquinol oxidase subunit II
MLWLPEYYVAVIMFFSLILYMLTGGADFGAGIWDLLSFGPNAKKQRVLINQAIAPIWETNHIWLIIVVVLMFIAFPSAFSTLCTALHIPLTIMLIGIVLRGSAFVFRAHDEPNRPWGIIFATGSIVSPLMLGISLGAIASGNIHLDFDSGDFYSNFIAPWLAPFPIAIGFLTLVLCAFSAATYLIFESNDQDLKNIFRKRTFIAMIVLFLLAAITLFLSREGAPRIYAGLLQKSWYAQLPMFIGFLGILIFVALKKRWDFVTRLAGMLQVIGMIIGWGISQFPYLIVDSHTIRDSAAPDSILIPILIVFAIGALAFIPSYGYLYYVFKRN